MDAGLLFTRRVHRQDGRFYRMDANRLLSLLPKIEIVAIGKETLIQAESHVSGCEACDPAAAHLFIAALDEITERHDRLTEYILVQPAVCARCGGPITENTVVALKSDLKRATASSSGFEVPIEEVDVRLVDEDLIHEAEEWIAGCEHCTNPADYSFDQILDSLTGCDPAKTEYAMYRPAKCPTCRRQITEKTLVRPA